MLLCIGLAAFAVLIWATRKVMALERALDAGDVVVLSVFAIFAAACARMAWRLFRNPPSPQDSMGAGSPTPAAPQSQDAPAAPPRRVTLSHGCAAAGVLLLILAVLAPEHWYPGALLFLGLALLAVSHVLTPCVERIEQLRKARASERQL